MTLVPNLPTAEGRQLGAHLDRFYLKELGAKADHRCPTCAFRAGTDPNGSPATTMDAMKCLMEGVPFLCHEQRRACAGWLLLRTSPGQGLRMPWPFSDEPPERDPS